MCPLTAMECDDGDLGIYHEPLGFYMSVGLVAVTSASCCLRHDSVASCNPAKLSCGGAFAVSF